MAQRANNAHLLIAGCGYVGREVARQYLALPGRDHHFITGTAGSTNSLDKIAALGIEARRLDLDARAELSAPLDPWSLLYMVPPGRTGPGDLRLGRLLRRIASNPPQVLVYLSTSGVYGHRKSKLTRESDIPTPATERARRRLDAESRIRAFAQDHGARWIILRVPGIYGPGRLRLEAIERGEPILREQDCGPGNRIHRDDLAACCRQALITPFQDRIFNVCDDDHASSCAFTLEVARQAGLPAPPQISLAEARQQFSAMRLSFLEETRLLDNTLMHDQLGVTLRYPDLASGIAASLEAAGD